MDIHPQFRWFLVVYQPSPIQPPATRRSDPFHKDLSTRWYRPQPWQLRFHHLGIFFRSPKKNAWNLQGTNIAVAGKWTTILMAENQDFDHGCGFVSFRVYCAKYLYRSLRIVLYDMFKMVMYMWHIYIYICTFSTWYASCVYTVLF